jgi:hypothetical protein
MQIGVVPDCPRRIRVRQVGTLKAKQAKIPVSTLPGSSFRNCAIIATATRRGHRSRFVQLLNTIFFLSSTCYLEINDSSIFVKKGPPILKSLITPCPDEV